MGGFVFDTTPSLRDGLDADAAPDHDEAAPNPARGLGYTQGVNMLSPLSAGASMVNQMAGGRPAAAAVPNLHPAHLAKKNPGMFKGTGGGTSSARKGKRKRPGRSIRSDRLSYDKQPDAFRAVVDRSFKENASTWFFELSDQQRSTVMAMYNRMVDHGLWTHVREIAKVVPGEAKVGSLGPLELTVAGRSVSLEFVVYSGRSLRDTMVKSKLFGVDGFPYGVMHPGRSSLREWRANLGGTGLHLSIAPNNEADAHLDKVSPTDKPSKGATRMNAVHAMEHHMQEVWPELIRAKGVGLVAKLPKHVVDWLFDAYRHYFRDGRTKAGELVQGFLDHLQTISDAMFGAIAKVADVVFAGIEFKPADKVEHPDPSQRTKGSDIVAIKTIRFGKGDKGKGRMKGARAPAGEAAITQEAVLRAVARAVGGLGLSHIKPPGGSRALDDYADVATIGHAMARKIWHKAKYDQGRGRFELELGPAYDKLSGADIKALQGQLSTVGKAVREAMVGALTKDPTMQGYVKQVIQGHAFFPTRDVWFKLL